ncbi:MAG: OB-fold nucleic acid binding domain-containing protein, partial [candidate division Zixibacteria bacterium]
MAAFAELKRNCTCGQLRSDDSDREVLLNGWIASYRNLGGLLFFDMRDRYGLTQVVINPETFDKEMLAAAERTRSEFVVAVKGKVQARPDGTINKKMVTGEIEVNATEFHILAESATPP